jgi:hypothetical protein
MCGPVGTLYGPGPAGPIAANHTGRSARTRRVASTHQWWSGGLAGGLYSPMVERGTRRAASTHPLHHWRRHSRLPGLMALANRAVGPRPLLGAGPDADRWLGGRGWELTCARRRASFNIGPGFLTGEKRTIGRYWSDADNSADAESSAHNSLMPFQSMRRLD